MSTAGGRAVLALRVRWKRSWRGPLSERIRHGSPYSGWHWMPSCVAKCPSKPTHQVGTAMSGRRSPRRMQLSERNERVLELVRRAADVTPPPLVRRGPPSDTARAIRGRLTPNSRHSSAKFRHHTTRTPPGPLARWRPATYYCPRSCRSGNPSLRARCRSTCAPVLTGERGQARVGRGSRRRRGGRSRIACGHRTGRAIRCM